jgi:hypothetical protein
MKKSAPALILAVGLFLASPPRAQERRPWFQEKPSEPEPSAGSTDPMAWERDFELLLEAQNIPTKGQLVSSARMAALLQERDAEEAKLVDAKKRLAQLRGTYTTEVLLNEMLRLEVRDFQSVQAKLEAEIRLHQRRLSEISDQIKRLKPPSG